MHVLYLNPVCILKFLLFFSSYWLNTSVQALNTSNVALPATSLQILQMLPMIQTIYAFSASSRPSKLSLPLSFKQSLQGCKSLPSSLCSYPLYHAFLYPRHYCFTPQWLTMLSCALSFILRSAKKCQIYANTQASKAR